MEPSFRHRTCSHHLSWVECALENSCTKHAWCCGMNSSWTGFFCLLTFLQYLNQMTGQFNCEMTFIWSFYVCAKSIWIGFYVGYRLSKISLSLLPCMFQLKIYSLFLLLLPIDVNAVVCWSCQSCCIVCIVLQCCRIRAVRLVRSLCCIFVIIWFVMHT